MEELFRYEWQDRYFFRSSVWLALGGDGDDWWCDVRHHGRFSVAGGVQRLVDFANWLREPRGEDWYEASFDLVGQAPGGTVGVQQRDGTTRHDQTTIDLEVMLGRKGTGDPEELIVSSAGSIVGTRFGFQTCAELVDVPLDRPRIEEQARRLTPPDDPVLVGACGRMRGGSDEREWW